MLTDREVKAAQPGEKRYALSDGNGLILEVRTGGQKYWISRTWDRGREQRKQLGVYPEMNLRQAREENILLKRSATKRREAITFGELAEEWMERRLQVSEGHLRTIILRLEKYILPALGNLPAGEISPPEILAVCRLAEDRGFIETAHRVRGIIGQVYRYGIAAGYVAHDPSSPLRGALKPSKSETFPP